MVIKKTWLIKGALAAAACGVFAAQDVPSALAKAQNASAAPAAHVPSAKAQTAPAEAITPVSQAAMAARTRKIVDAANVFLSTLSPEQKKLALFAWTDGKQRVRWSNFPQDIGFVRAGPRYGKLREVQREALHDLLATILSTKGMKMVQEQMDADDILKITADGPVGPKPPYHDPKGPDLNFGSDFYHVSFVGTPSTTEPWMFQFGGHHMGLNATVVGPHVTLAPSVTGGEPLQYFHNGKPVYIVEDEATKGTDLLNSLTPDQRSKAIISTKLIDLVMGPGHDGLVLQPEGLMGKDMTAAQKAKLLALIEARIGILNADSLAEQLVAIRKNLDQTSFGWWGPTEFVGTGYFRITGPTVMIEFAPQPLDARFPTPFEHGHNMYRDPINDYGSSWAMAPIAPTTGRRSADDVPVDK